MWPFTALQTVLGILGLVVGSVVVLGQWQMAKQKSWREAAEGGNALANSLKAQLEDAVVKSNRERELLTVQIQALQGQLSLVQHDHEEDRNRTEAQMARLMRLNHRLQNQLDQNEANSIKQTVQLQEHMPDLPDREPHHELPPDPEDAP